MRKIIIMWFAAMLASTAAFADCSGWATGVSGLQMYINHEMKYCDGTNWRQMGPPACSHTPTWSPSSNSWECITLASCKAILNAGQSSGNGTYTINPGTGDMTVYCDMSVDGGGWTLVVSHNTSTTPTASTSVSPNSGTYMSNSAYTALNAAATEYLFYTTNSGTYYLKMPKTYAIGANCQNMSTALPVYLRQADEYEYGWSDPGCDVTDGDFSGVLFGHHQSLIYLGFYAYSGSPGSYSTSGASGSWTTLSASSLYEDISGTDVLLGFVR